MSAPGTEVVGIAALSIAILLLPATGEARDWAPECAQASDGPPTIVAGEIACQGIQSHHMGAETVFTYFVPPGCDPIAHSGRRCPVAYLLHGAGGHYQSSYMLPGIGTDDAAYARALTSGPPFDPNQGSEPWIYADPDTWVSLPTIDMILIAPDNRTVPGGHGPGPFQETAWIDWNPRYAEGGEYERYPTPPPRVSSFLADELVPYVDAYFPTIARRRGRALIGTSAGGLGTFANGLRRPDVWASLGMTSGAGWPFPAVQDVPAAAAVEVVPPAPIPYATIPGPVPLLVPEPALVSVPLVSVLTVGFGDPVIDQIWWRSNSVPDLATNARAGAGGEQSIHLRYFVNDMIPRRVEDVTEKTPDRIVADVALEGAVFSLSTQLEPVFERHGIERHFEIHPGVHHLTYWAPWYRKQLAAHYARLEHWDGSGSPPPRPYSFDYRTIATSFDIWGWHVEVDRAPTEFLNLTDVTCNGVTLRGSGVVTIVVPESCGTGVDGDRTFVVDLGPAWATDEPMGVGSVGDWGRTLRQDLEPL